MGWKSTIDINREEAIKLILEAQNRTAYDDMTDDELTNLLYGYGYGDDPNLPHFGYNFSIIDDND